MKLLLLLCILISTAFGKTSIVQKATGKEIEVELISQTSTEVTFHYNGKDFTVPFDTLTDESVTSIQSESEDTEESPTSDDQLSLNETIGHELFTSESLLWDEPAAVIAKRLKWRLESRKDGNSSYRLYTKPEYLFLGAHPYCVTLYGGKEDVPLHLSLIFANKGDFGSRLGVGEDHFKKIHPNITPPKDLDDAIETDEDLISESLTQALGPHREQQYGEKEDRRVVKRWDLNGHSFLLSSKREEYVHLLVVPSSNADSGGKVTRVTDTALKKLQSENVRTEENGDVWIDNIPMVNQGPKGYCAPASFERAMRYMHIPADMYLLATAATTQQGTNTAELALNCKRIVRSKTRRIRDLELEGNFGIREVKKYIDKGVPILWAMASLPSYNTIANSRTKERATTDDFSEWGKEIQKEADGVVKSIVPNDNFHICLIIGYNKETKEVAVSDSWGANYELRWIHEDIASAVTRGNSFVIDF